MKVFFVFLSFLSLYSFVSFGQMDYKKFLHLDYVELDTLYESAKAQEQYEALLPYAQAACEKAEKEFGKQDTLTAKWLYNLGYAYDYGIEDYDKALEFYNKATSIQKIKIPISVSYANTLFAMGDIYAYNLSQYDQAEPIYLAGIAIREKVLGKQHPVYAESLDNLAILYDNMGNYEKAVPLYLQAIEIRKKALGEQHPDYAQSLHNLAVFHEKMGSYTKAEPLFLQAMTIRKKILGEEHPDYAQSLNNLALLYMNTGSYTKAENLLLQATTIQKKSLGEQHPTYAISLNTLAGLYKNIGNYAKAESLFLQAMMIRKKALGEEHSVYATNLNDLAGLYSNMGDYTKAEPLYLQAIAIFKKTLGVQHPNYASSLNNLALLYDEMKDYAKAESLYLEAMSIRKQILGEQHPSYATSLNNLAAFYENIGNYNKAESFYLQAISILKKTFGEQHPTYATGINNLALLYQDIKNYPKAESLYLQAMEIRKKALGEQHPEYVQSLNNLATLYRNMEKLDTAFYYCKLGILANAPAMDKNFADWKNLDTFKYVSNSHANRSIRLLLSILQKQYKQSKDQSKLENSYIISQAAIRLNERFRNEFTTEGEKLRILAENNAFVLSAIKTSVELKKPDYESIAFGFSEINKGVLLLESAKTANAQQFGGLPDSLAEQENNLQKKQSNLTAKLLENRPEYEKDSLRRVLNQLYQEIDVFTKVLKNNFPKYAALKYRSQSANAREIQALLDDKTALLEYMVGDSVVYIFYVDKTQVRLIPIYLSNIILNAKIKALHSVLSNYELATKEPAISYKKYTENAFWFYENLVAPALTRAGNFAKNISNLVIISDGELGHLPFETFLTKTAAQKQTDYHQLHYLSNDYKISYNYSATLWKTAKEGQKNTHNGQILGMASNYSSNNSTTSSTRLPYEQRLRELLIPLPAAEKEIETLAENFNGFFAFNKDASEKNFKAKASDYAIIHLAMHGLLDAKNPILSSLAFTEDGDSLENNFLQAYEISKMKLNADLVVLSACETGYGRFEKGNGIASLAQAFAYAGVPAMIVSLWQVSDYATSEIMKNLYQNLANGMTKDEALQQAKIKYLQQARGVAAHPAFWSPFILMGNCDAIVLGRSSDGTLVWIIGIGVLILGGIAIAISRRKKE